MKIRYAAGVLMLLLVQAACATQPQGSGGSEVELRTDKARYRAAEKMTLTLTNRTSKSFTFNPCTRIVERESGGTWSEVKEDRVCTMEAWILAPNSSRSGDTEMPAGAAPGRYRVVIALVQEGTGPPGRAVRAVSEPVEIF